MARKTIDTMRFHLVSGHSEHPRSLPGSHVHPRYAHRQSYSGSRTSPPRWQGRLERHAHRTRRGRSLASPPSDAPRQELLDDMWKSSSPANQPCRHVLVARTVWSGGPIIMGMKGAYANVGAERSRCRVGAAAARLLSHRRNAAALVSVARETASRGTARHRTVRLTLAEDAK